MQAEQTYSCSAPTRLHRGALARFLDDPSRVEADWRTSSKRWPRSVATCWPSARRFLGANAPRHRRTDTEMPRAAANRNLKAGNGAAMPLAGQSEESIRAAAYDTSRAFLLIRSYRIRGHLEANLDRLAWSPGAAPGARPRDVWFSKRPIGPLHPDFGALGLGDGATLRRSWTGCARPIAQIGSNTCHLRSRPEGVDQERIEHIETAPTSRSKAAA